MWSNGTNDDPGWPTLTNGAYDPWREARTNSLIFTHRQREEDTRRTRGASVRVRGGLTILVLLIGSSALVRLHDLRTGYGTQAGLLAGHGAQALVLSVIGLCWFLGRRQRMGWRGRVLLLALVLGGLLTGCQDMSRTVARMTGCDDQAIDAGYCHMPKEGKR